MRILLIALSIELVAVISVILKRNLSYVRVQPKSDELDSELAFKV